VDYLDVIAEESAAFRKAAAGNLEAQVPSCPEWKVGDLVAHLGAVQRFHALHVVRGVDTQPTERADIPDGDDGLLEWFDGGTQILLDALRGTPADAPAWNFTEHVARVAAFWPRRMALEAAVHRWDCQRAADAADHVADVATDVAVDGIDEVLRTHLPADRADEKPPERGVVEVRLTDADARWTVELTEDSAVPTQKTPDAVLEGTASGVFLALWGRVPLSSFDVQGDEALRTG
jgi:uncharacterized protein (TIGR03083 family)